MMYYGNGMGVFGPLVMIAGNLLFWGLLIAGVVVLVRLARQGRLPAMPEVFKRTPREILDERLARGEIDADEYQKRIDALTGPSARP